MSTNFHLAPPAKTVDGLLAVPIDIQTIAASFVFDGATASGAADATIQYTVGPTGGNPIFDLRQTITSAWLDSAVFPVAQLAAHDFGAGAFSELRIIESVQTAGSVHTLRTQYGLGAPAVELGGYQPALEWSSGPRLRLSFGMSDLRAGRYLEAWLPANLVFDQYAIQLEITLQNTPIAHTLISNGQVTLIGLNHWSVSFPARFTSLSPLVEIRPTDTLESASDTHVLPVSGTVVTIDAWKLTGGAANLVTEIANIKTHLTDNENDYGSYVHGNRFTAFFNVGGMEYEGGTTTGTGPLRHETFHSWFARGVKPSGQAEGWWDEGFTTYHDNGADDATPFDFADPPITLCSRDPWQRRTPNNSYTDGSRFWRGVASMIGIGNLNARMRSLYEKYKGEPVSTAMVEEFLMSTSAEPGLVDAFHRFVYGLPDPAPVPDLWMRDELGHSGADVWNGAFWDSPDLWIRNQDDGGNTHQAPEYGQDNWFHARVRNKAAAGLCRHFVVTFHAKGFAGTEFVFPGDFLPCLAARAEFDLEPGGVRVVRARWPRALVPRAGSHACLLASVIARLDSPASGLHVWEHNNLAQKNLTIVDLQPNQFIIIPIVLRTLSLRRTRYLLEVWRDPRGPKYDVALVGASKDLFGRDGPRRIRLDRRIQPELRRRNLLDCGGPAGEAGRRGDALITSDRPDLIAERFGAASMVRFAPGRTARLPVELQQSGPRVIGLLVAVPPDARPGTAFKTHLAQRHRRTRQLTGGVAVEVRVRD